MKMERELVFVYGTLREGAAEHGRLEEAELVEEAWVLGRLFVIDWYPGLVLDDEGIPVRGEVYAVEKDLLRKLDDFEGAEYERVRAIVNLKSGESREVWVYDYQGELKGRKELIPADWLQDRIEQAPPIFSVLTFALLLLSVGLGVLAWGSAVPMPGGLKAMSDVLSVIAPLAPFVTSVIARKRTESLAEGAEVCGAIGLLLFGTTVIVRYLPVLFGVFAN